MFRELICLAVLLLTGCSEVSRDRIDDPAYPSQPTYQAFIRQHLLLTEGKIFANFPGMLDCFVEASTEGYTPGEMKMLDTYAQKPEMATLNDAVSIEKARKARQSVGEFLDRHPECRDIRAKPGAFSSGQDYTIQEFLNRNAPQFDKHDISDELRQAAATCYWGVMQSQMSPSDKQALDNFATGGPHLSKSSKQPDVTRDKMTLACPQTMEKLERYLTDYTYTLNSGWPGR